MNSIVRFFLPIILSIISVPMFAQKVKPLVDKETIKAEQEVLKAKLPGAKIKTIKYDDGSVYVGECNKKAKEGVGTLFLPSGDIYRGGWASDSMTGEGQMAYANGDNYSGMWKNGEREGQGVLSYHNGDEYKGEWSEDQFNGRGIFVSKLYSYDGEWKNGKRWGDGTVSFSSGDKYSGQWENDSYCGHGIMTYETGDIYDGNWESGVRNGQGKMRFSNGDQYEGQWVNGERNGVGKMIFSDKRVYEGSWAENKINGIGTMSYSSGAKYEGNWVDGKRSGSGKLIFANGEKWEGEWQNNSFFSGKGTSIDVDGNVERGEWKEGSFFNGYLKCKDMNGLTYDGEISQGKAMNGKISFVGNEYSMTGEIKNGIPYVTFTGVLPKDEPMFRTIYTSTGWDEISSGEKEGRVSGNFDVVGVFSKEIRKTKSSKERKVEDSGRGDFTTVITNPYSIKQLVKLSVEGHLLDGHFAGDVSISADFGSIHTVYYQEGGSSSTEIYSQTTSSTKWSDGKWISGDMQIVGKLNGDYFLDEFNLRTEGAQKNDFVVVSNQYGVLGKSSDLLNTSKPSSIADVITWLNTEAPKRIRTKNGIEANKRASAEISSITKNREQWRRNAVRLRDVRNSFNNNVAKNKYLSNPFAIMVYVERIMECYDGKHKYSLTIDDEGLTGCTITIDTNDDSFVDLDYPCRACIYVKSFKTGFFDTWLMTGGVYLGRW